MDWIENGCTDDLTYASFEPTKYHKHLMKLQIQKGILMRQFVDDIGKISHSHVWVQNICEKKSFTEYIVLPQEDILVLLEQRKNFANDSIFLDFQNIWLTISKTVFLARLQKESPKNNCSLHFNFIGTAFSGWHDANRLSSTLPVAIYKNALSGMDFFQNIFSQFRYSCKSFSFNILSIQLHTYQNLIWLRCQFCCRINSWDVKISWKTSRTCFIEAPPHNRSCWKITCCIETNFETQHWWKMNNMVSICWLSNIYA